MGALPGRIAAWLTPARVRLYPATAIAVVVLGYAVSIAIGTGRTDAAGAIVGADFSAFYWAGTTLRTGEHDLYDIDAEAEFLGELIAPVASEEGEVHAFVSPPYWALFFFPFGLLPYEAALGLFWALSLGLLATNLVLLRRALPSLAPVPLGRALFWALCFFPVTFSFLGGQTSMIVLVPLVLSFSALRKERDFQAGLALGLLAVKPQLAVCLGLVFLGARRWRALLGAAISAGAWLAIGWLVMPEAMASYRELAPELFEFLRRDDYYTWGQLSVVGFFTLMLDPISHAAGSLVGYGAGLGLAGAIAVDAARTPWRPGTRAWDLRIAALITAGLVTTPHLFLYDASLLLLPLAIVVAWLGSRDPDRILDGGPVLASIGILWVALFAGPYLTSALQDVMRAHSIPAVVIQLPTLAVLYFAWRTRAAAIGGDERARVAPG